MARAVARSSGESSGEGSSVDRVGPPRDLAAPTHRGIIRSQRRLRCVLIPLCHQPGQRREAVDMSGQSHRGLLRRMAAPQRGAVVLPRAVQGPAGQAFRVPTAMPELAVVVYDIPMRSGGWTCERGGMGCRQLQTPQGSVRHNPLGVGELTRPPTRGGSLGTHPGSSSTVTPPVHTTVGRHSDRPTAHALIGHGGSHRDGAPGCKVRHKNKNKRSVAMAVPAVYTGHRGRGQPERVGVPAGGELGGGGRPKVRCRHEL